MSYSLFSYSVDNSQLSNQESNQFEQKQRLAIAEQQRLNLKNRSIINFDDEIQISHDQNRCFFIKTIYLKGTTIFSDKQKNKLIESYINHCLTINNIHHISQLISNHYINEGYITTQVSFPEQDLMQGVLTIVIIEGVIESINIQDSPNRTMIMIYPNLVGKTLNLRDIEQGLEQLNRLSSYRYSIDIQSIFKQVQKWVYLIFLFIVKERGFL